MAEAFLNLSGVNRRDALGVAAFASGRPADLLEKDVWVVWSLGALFEAPFGEHLSFKGGTSLSKAHNAIARFSEDLDITYDIRSLLPDLAGHPGEPLPASRSQGKRWSDLVRERLPAWVSGTVLPHFEARLAQSGMPAQVRADADCLLVRYERVIEASTDYVKPEVKVEFGARSTGEPATEIQVWCDAAEHLPMLTFPIATPRVMAAERTFWEKATAIHVFCHQGRLRGERYARHWYDIVRLDDAGIAEQALADRDIARRVAQHKRWFFPEKDTERQLISYDSAVSGSLRLVPNGEALTVLQDDYERMIEAGLLEEDPQPFAELIARCGVLEQRANRSSA